MVRDGIRDGRALAIALLAGFALACASTSEKLAERLFARDQPLVFDRGSRLLPPEGLRVTSNQDREIALAWDPVLVGDVAGYAILRAKGSGEDAYARVGITQSRFGTVFTDAGASATSVNRYSTLTTVHPICRYGSAPKTRPRVAASERLASQDSATT